MRQIHNFSETQSRTKLLENFYPSMHTIQRNNTISTTTDLRYQIPLPPGQCCFLQMSKDQGCFRTHNNIASKGRGEGRTRYSENVRKNGLRMWHFLNSFVEDCSSAVCGFSLFWLTVFSEIRLFTVLRYRLFALSFPYNAQNKTQ